MKRFLYLFVAVVVLSLTTVGARRLYERHVSSDLKRVVAASLDPSASAQDIRHYIQEGRLMVRTRKDSEVMSKLEAATGLMIFADQTRHETLARQQQQEVEMGSHQDPASQLLVIRAKYIKSRLPVPREVDEELAKSTKNERLLAETLNKSLSLADEQLARATELNQELRAEVGLPPLSTKN